MTTALYRRYRPDTFQDVIGQDHVITPLMSALRGDRVTHAYLFSGPRGCGKTTSARILARCLNCEQGPTDTPCGTCPSCVDLATGGPGSLDVVEIDAASHNGVDDARDLRERAAFAPVRDRYKIFILDEAHMVTPQGFNALLKLVEEPPAHVKFVFATTEPEKVIGTIRSRTHHYPFRLVPPDVLEGYLEHLCAQENVEVGPGVFPMVVRAGGGSVRDTLSVMDQLIGGATDAHVDYHSAVALLGYTDTALLDSCVDAIAGRDGAAAFSVIERVISSGHDPRRFVEDVLQRLRDLLVIALAGDRAGAALGSLPDDQLQRMQVQAQSMGPRALSHSADMTAQALGQMVGATSPRLQLELLMARLLVPSDAAAAQPASSAPASAAPSASQGGIAGGAVSARHAAAAAAQTAAAKSRAEREQAETVASQPPAHSHHGSQEAPAGGQGSQESAHQVSTAGKSASWDVPQQPTVQQQAPAPVVTSWDSDSEHTREPHPSARSSAPSAPSTPADPERDEVQQPSTSRPEVSHEAHEQPHSAPGAAVREDSAARVAQRGQGGGGESEMIRGRWQEVLEAVKRNRRATWALVGPHVQPGSFDGSTLTLIFPSPGLLHAFDRGGHRDVLAGALHDALGIQADLHPVVGDGAGGAPASDGAPFEHGGHRAVDHEVIPVGPEPAQDDDGQPEQSDEWEPVTPVGQVEATEQSDGWGPVAPVGQVEAQEKSDTWTPEAYDAPQATSGEPALATVHRLHPLPTVAHQQASAPSPHRDSTESGDEWGSASTSWEPSFVTQARHHEKADHGSSTPDQPVSSAHSPSSVHSETPQRMNQAQPQPEHQQQLDDETEVEPLPENPTESTPVLPGDSPHATAWESPATASWQPPASTAWESAATTSWEPSAPQHDVPQPLSDTAESNEWTPPPGSRMAQAMAAARAAAALAAAGGSDPASDSQRGHAPKVAPEDDEISDDDLDAEEAGMVGVDVVKRLLGARVIEEVTVTGEGR